MQRRGESGQPVKGRRHSARPKAHKGATARASITDLEEQVAELTHELKEAREQHAATLAQQTATSEILRTISSSPTEIGPVFHAILENAIRLCGGDVAVLWQFDGQVLRFTAGNNASSEAHLRAHPLELGTYNPTALAGLEQRTVHELDVFANPAYRPLVPATNTQRPRSSTVLAVPLVREGKLLGVITIWRFEKRLFADKQIELVKNFAEQAVIAIENVRLFEAEQQRTRELSESLEQQTATSEVLKVISSSPGELEPVFSAMLANAVRICEAKFGTMYGYHGGLFHVTAMLNTPPALADFFRQRGSFVPARGVPLDRLLQTKMVIHTDQAAEQNQAPSARLGGARSHIAVPMLKENKLIGAIVIYRQEVKPFTDKQIELVQNFAAQAVIAIENARLLNELRQRTDDLGDALEQQTATSEVLRVISSSQGELQPVFDSLLDNATRLCGAKFGSMFLCEGDDFRVVAHHKNTPPAIAELRRRDPIVRAGPSTAVRRSTKTKQAVQIPDIMAEPAYSERDPNRIALVELGGYRAVLSVPMLKDNEVIGAINIYRQETGAFEDKQVELVKNFAAQAVIAIENTRLLNELRESLQQQTATADVLKVISRSTFDLQTVLQTLVESAARLCDADRVNITREKNGAFYRAEAYGFSREFQEYVKDVPIKAERGSSFGRALLEGRVVHIPDVLADSEYTYLEGQRLGDYRTVLTVPMLREGVPSGVLSLTRSEVRPFTDKQIELATTFADQAAIAIENVRLFERVEARTRELSASLEDLRTAQDRLVQTQKLASLGQLTAGIAHEIKNPLNFVNNFSGVSAELVDELQQALKDVSLNEKRRGEIAELMDTLRGNLDKIVQHGKRADAIVKNMLLHSREGSGEHRVVDTNALVEESLNLAYHGARAERQGFAITLQRSFDPSAGEIDVFPQDITRALLNLISNGFYAATKRKAEVNGGDYEPTLTAATKNLGDRVEISIRDNGIGIPPDVKAKMFNPFFTTKPAGEGTGLGLSISHDIVVKQHGGSIEVDTQPGEFTEIRIILPRTAMPVAERA